MTRGVVLRLSAALARRRSSLAQIADDGVLEEWEQRLLRDVAAAFLIPLGAAIPVIQNIAAGQVARMQGALAIAHHHRHPRGRGAHRHRPDAHDDHDDHDETRGARARPGAIRIRPARVV